MYINVFIVRYYQFTFGNFPSVRCVLDKVFKNCFAADETCDCDKVSPVLDRRLTNPESPQILVRPLTLHFHRCVIFLFLVRRTVVHNFI